MTVIAELLTFVKSITAGFAMCLPIGPLSIVVTRKVINAGKKKALVTGLGSMTADVFYATIAGAGMAFIAEFLFKHQLYLQVGAATILFVMSFRMLRRKHVPRIVSSKTVSLIDDFSLGFFLALLNPATLFLMTTLLSALHVAIPATYGVHNVLIVIGLLIGELLWWLLLIHAADWAQARFGLRSSLTINHIAGVILFALAGAILIRAVFFK